jgi:glycosyltransferase involved in cell wall biosynthesis
MRILFLTYAYERGLAADAGGFRKLWELARALGRLGAEPLVLYPGLPGHRPLLPVPSRAYPVVDAPLLRPLTAYLAMVASALVEGRRRIDVVYFRSGLNVLPLLLGPALGARLVLEVNANAGEFLEREGASRLRRGLFARAERLNARRSDRVVAITEGLKRMLVARYGLAPAKVLVIPSGTDPDHFRPEDPALARERIGLPPDVQTVGFVGLFYRHQGVPTLLEALARLRGRVPRLLGLVIGDGVMRGAWEALARGLGLGATVRFPGQVPYAEVPTYLSALDVVVAPFTGDRGETSPFKVLDAMASGRPVVATALPSIRELSEGSGALTLVPPDDAEALADALEGLLADPGRREALGQKGREYVVAQHAWDRIAERLLAAL